MRGSISEREHASPAGDLEPARPEASPRWPLVVVGVVILFNLVVLRAEARPVQNLNDASVHRSMIAWASERVEDGHLPLDGWYPDLALGSSRFHHYQSFPHVLTGFLALAVVEEIIRARPSSAKGKYVKTLTVSTTMGPGVPIDPNRIKGTAEAAQTA